MAARARHGRRRRGGGTEPPSENERWLLTYADMITLLMALFMVMFSISSVNISKYKSLQSSLQEAFSGRILPGGKSIQERGGSADRTDPSAPEPPAPAIVPTQAQKAGAHPSEEDAFRALKQRIDSYAAGHGLAHQLQATVARRGLVIRLLTDRVLFDSGQAALKPQAAPLLGRIAQLVRTEVARRPTVVEGHTDDVPIRDGSFPSNWELSTARASIVVRFLIRRGVSARHLSAAGFSATHPIASNRTLDGRHRNRRVEIVVLREAAGSTG
jgi:chemotaxis protein MotB